MEAAPWRPDPRLPRHAWIPFGIGLLLFALTRWLPAMDWATPQTDLFLLDQGFVEALREHPGRYSVLEPHHHHAFGAHVLTRMALAKLSGVTGDSQRAGIWLSLAGLLACIAAIFPLCRSILPVRGYAMVTVAALAGIGAVQGGFSPDPSQAIGMALLAWGVALFVSSLHRHLPMRMFLSAALIALAGYVRIELSLLWILLAIYLIVLSLVDSHHRAEGFPLVATALGGLLLAALLLWPQFHRNLVLTGTPILPGGDAQHILGAATPVTGPDAASLSARFGQGLVMLATGSSGVGIFLGMLWPVGLVISTLINRHRAAPYFWLPLLGSWLLLLTLLSPITGEQSFLECLRMSVPLFLPFALLVPVFGFFHWVQSQPRSPAISWAWWGLAGLAYVLAITPGLIRGSAAGLPETHAADHAMLDLFRENRELRESRLLTDRPGLFVAAGKRGVYGLKGETDWEILAKKYANGTYRMEELVPYLRAKNIAYLHLSDIESSLDTSLKLAAGGPLCEPVEGLRPPHRLFQLHWP